MKLTGKQSRTVTTCGIHHVSFPAHLCCPECATEDEAALWDTAYDEDGDNDRYYWESGLWNLFDDDPSEPEPSCFDPLDYEDEWMDDHDID
jgi:hypothetical protein